MTNAKALTLANNNPSNTTEPTPFDVPADADATLTWALWGWYSRLQTTRHPMHTANSWAKHEFDLPAAHDEMMAIAMRRLMEQGCTMAEAIRLMRGAAARRDEKLFAEPAANTNAATSA